VRVDSPRNRRVAEAVRLHHHRERVKTGRALLEGPTLLAEAGSAGVKVEVVFATSEDRRSAQMAASTGAELVVVGERVLRHLGTTENPQSPVSVVVVPGRPIPDAGHLLVAWGVGDPGNVGTLIRSAAAFGLGFACGPGTADPWSPKVLRSAAGGHFRSGVADVETLERLRAGGRVLVATVVSGGMPPMFLPPSRWLAILIGDEASGLPREVVEACDLAVTVPMPGGTESLNAAIAGAIVAYEVAARGPGGAPRGD
jgi:TrmH family RNA methyltransferase